MNGKEIFPEETFIIGTVTCFDNNCVAETIIVGTVTLNDNNRFTDFMCTYAICTRWFFFSARKRTLVISGWPSFPEQLGSLGPKNNKMRKRKFDNFVIFKTIFIRFLAPNSALFHFHKTFADFSRSAIRLSFSCAQSLSDCGRSLRM